MSRELWLCRTHSLVEADILYKTPINDPYENTSFCPVLLHRKVRKQNVSLLLNRLFQIKYRKFACFFFQDSVYLGSPVYSGLTLYTR